MKKGRKQSTTALAVAKVTRKGQVTIPADFRREHRIREGGKVTFQRSGAGLVLMPVPPLDELVGIDSGKISYREASKWLDESRSEDHQY
jgi:AbrB family looped-hinge helix DNA binding protein